MIFYNSIIGKATKKKIICGEVFHKSENNPFILNGENLRDKNADYVFSKLLEAGLIKNDIDEDYKLGLVEIPKGAILKKVVEVQDEDENFYFQINNIEFVTPMFLEEEEFDEFF